MTASASRGQRLSRITGPASSQRPSLSASTRGASRATQSSRIWTTRASRASGAGPGEANTRLMIGHTGDRTSSVAARFMMPTTFSILALAGHLSKSSTRWAEP
jgi:hypothetical protein